MLSMINAAILKLAQDYGAEFSPELIAFKLTFTLNPLIITPTSLSSFKSAEAQSEAVKSLPIADLKQQMEEIEKQYTEAISKNNRFSMLNSAVLAHADKESAKFIEEMKKAISVKEFRSNLNQEYIITLYKSVKNLDSTFTPEHV